jgi:hypothetical protein
MKRIETKNTLTVGVVTRSVLAAAALVLLYGTAFMPGQAAANGTNGNTATAAAETPALRDSVTTPAPAAAVSHAVEKKLALEGGSTLTVNGNSNVHRWHSKATQLRLTASMPMQAPGDAKAMRAAIQAGQPVRFELRIPVKGLKSDKAKLDENMYKALAEPANPEILFTLDSYTPSTSAAGDTLAVATKGRLKVAGQEKAIDMRVAFTPSNGGMRVKGRANLKMTMFGIKPPTMMLGTLRTHDDVVIEFDLGLQPVAGSGN